MIFQYESFLATFPPRNSKKSQPRTSMGSPVAATVPRSVHFDMPVSPAT